MADTVRLFTALTVPDTLKQQVKSLPRSGLEGKWTHSDDLHITIRYLGPVAAEILPAVKEALAAVRRPSFHVEVRGLGCFGNRRQTILYADVESTRKLTALCADITDRLTPLGFDFGTRPFVPHVTLARLKRQAPVSHFIEKQARYIAARWEAEAFHLVESPGPDESGRHYRLLAAYPLLAASQ